MPPSCGAAFALQQRVGVLRATNGGELVLYGTMVGTDGVRTGTIAALDNSVVTLAGTTLQGGLLTTAGTGRIETPDGATLEGGTIGTGSVARVLEGAGLSLYNQVVNHGTLEVYQYAYLWLSTPLTGGGQVRLEPESSILNTVINQDHLIHGAGTLEAGVVNHGTISADVTGQALVFHADYTHTNHGLVEARSGGTIDFQGNVFGTGQYRADGGTLFIASNVTVSTTGNVTILNAGTLELNHSTLVAGTLTLDDTSTLIVASTLSLAGDFLHGISDPALWTWGEDGVLEMTGGVGASDTDPTGWAHLEAAGADLGDVPDGYTNNFQVAKLVIGPGAHVLVADMLDSGNRDGGPEALYVDVLEFADESSRLGLNGVTIYYNELIGDSLQIAVIPEPQSVGLVLFGLLALVPGRMRRCRGRGRGGTMVNYK